MLSVNSHAVEEHAIEADSSTTRAEISPELSKEGSSGTTSLVSVEMVTGDTPGLTLVIPAWNEEERLGPTLERYLPLLESRGGQFEVIVVVDGVEDGTADVAETFSSRHVRVLHFPRKLGKGGAVMEGLRASQFQFVGYVDADGPIPPTDILTILNKLADADCVIASRAVRGSHVLSREPGFRRLAGGVWNSLVRSVMFLPIRDTQCGAKFFRRSALVPVLNSVVVTDWAFDVSLLYHLRKTGSTIYEQPVTWSHGTGSQLVVTKVAPIMLLSLIGLRIQTLPLARHIPRSWLLRVAEGFGAA
jgi:glycosyltransferase involved in cell wall biosynthesis